MSASACANDEALLTISSVFRMERSKPIMPHSTTSMLMKATA